MGEDYLPGYTRFLENELMDDEIQENRKVLIIMNPQGEGYYVFRSISLLFMLFDIR